MLGKKEIRIGIFFTTIVTLALIGGAYMYNMPQINGRVQDLNMSEQKNKANLEGNNTEAIFIDPKDIGAIVKKEYKEFKQDVTHILSTENKVSLDINLTHGMAEPNQAYISKNDDNGTALNHKIENLKNLDVFESNKISKNFNVLGEEVDPDTGAPIKDHNTTTIKKYIMEFDSKGHPIIKREEGR